MNQATNRQSVIEQVTSAFEDVERPAAVVMAGHGLEGDDITKQLEGKRWPTMEREDFLPNWDMLTLLTPHAFRYFLPAFLLNALRHGTEEYIDVMAEWTMMNLMPVRTDENFHSQFHQRVSLLSQQQRSAVAMFIAYWVQEFPDAFPHPDTEAAERMLSFWHKLSV